MSLMACGFVTVVSALEHLEWQLPEAWITASTSQSLLLRW